MSDDKKQQFDFEEMLDYRKQASANMDYSVQRIDILIIALCTSGIILATTVIGKGQESNQELKWALLFFCISITVNLVSQFFGYYVNRRIVVIYDQKVIDFKDDPKNFDYAKYAEREAVVHRIARWIHAQNVLSFIFLLAGMVACLLYYYCQY